MLEHGFDMVSTTAGSEHVIGPSAGSPIHPRIAGRHSRFGCRRRDPYRAPSVWGLTAPSPRGLGAATPPDRACIQAADARAREAYGAQRR